MEFHYHTLIVHGGSFHSDDAMCAALARALNPDIKILRLLEVPEFLEDGIIAADIGRGRYDHHQYDAEYRPDGSKYAACGLLFRDFKMGLFPTERLADAFEKAFIRPIEDHDNGVAKDSLSMAVRGFHPAWDSDETMDHAFFQAVDFMYQIVVRETERAKSLAKADLLVSEAYEKSDKKVVYLEQYLPWQGVLPETEALFCVYPSQRGGYNIQCVPVEENSFVSKLLLPEYWKENMPEGCRFVHPTCFLSAFDTREHAREAIESFLKETEEVSGFSET